MLFSNRDYHYADQPTENELLLQAQNFIADNEEIIYTFHSDDIVTFFTNKKIIFVGDIKSKFPETELLPYKSINRCIVVDSAEEKYGKLDLIVSDEIIISFLLPTQKDAIDLCNKILLCQ